MFKIYFEVLNKKYSATVQKILYEPVQFIVFEISPCIYDLPERLVFVSHPVTDQLVYQSFDVRSSLFIRTIGESIFTTCYQQKIGIHSKKLQ